MAANALVGRGYCLIPENKDCLQACRAFLGGNVTARDFLVPIFVRINPHLKNAVPELPMLSQFRCLYPQGSLTSELVEIDHGLYIVKATVQVEGIILATGLAAQPRIEEAEDLARSRALMSLNLATPSSPLVETAPNLPVVKSSPVAPLIASEPAPLSSPPAIVDQEPLEPPPKTKTKKKVTPAPLLEPIPESTLELELVAPEPWSEPQHHQENGYTAEPESGLATVEPVLDVVPLTPVIAETEELEPLPNPEVIDFSEIIARSNIELKRLGWTSDQGRNYLLQTYGKRSRQLLSDEELLEFLQYLESQPSP